MAVHRADSRRQACGLDPVTDVKWFAGLCVKEAGFTLQKYEQRRIAYLMGLHHRSKRVTGIGAWLNWYIDRGRIPLPHKNERLVDSYIRRNSWRRAL